MAKTEQSYTWRDLRVKHIQQRLKDVPTICLRRFLNTELPESSLGTGRELQGNKREDALVANSVSEGTHDIDVNFQEAVSTTPTRRVKEGLVTRQPIGAANLLAVPAPWGTVSKCGRSVE
jgi:hypothetical protein